jgi:hypothetical protein
MNTSKGYAARFSSGVAGPKNISFFSETGKFMMQGHYFFVASLLASQAHLLQPDEKIWF